MAPHLVLRTIGSRDLQDGDIVRIVISFSCFIQHMLSEVTALSKQTKNWRLMAAPWLCKIMRNKDSWLGALKHSRSSCYSAGLAENQNLCISHPMFRWKPHFDKSTICMNIKSKCRIVVIHSSVFAFMIFQCFKMYHLACCVTPVTWYFTCKNGNIKTKFDIIVEAYLLLLMSWNRFPICNSHVDLR